MEKIITESEPENLHRKGQLNEVTLKKLVYYYANEEEANSIALLAGPGFCI